MGLFKKKDPIVEVEKALDHEVHEMEHDIQADVDAVMKKYDRESNTRIWEGAPKIALQVLMSAFSIYCILMTLFSKALPERRLSLFLGFIIIIGYLVYPARKGAARVNHVPWYDWLLMVLGAGSFFYFAINAFSIIQLATKLQPIHIIVGAIGIVVLIELCRRCVGLPILVVLGLLLVAQREQLWPTEAEVEEELAHWDDKRDGEHTFASNDRRRAAQRIASSRAAAFILAHSTLTPPPAEATVLKAENR